MIAIATVMLALKLCGNVITHQVTGAYHVTEAVVSVVVSLLLIAKVVQRRRAAH